MGLEHVRKKLNEHDWLAEARAPLVTLEDCYDVIDIGDSTMLI